MKISYVLLLAFLAVVISPHAAEQRVPDCDRLKWSALLLETNPDIRESCLGVYVRNNKYYARSQIELVRTNPGVLTFRPVHRDGKLGPSRRIPVPDSWRANIDGESYRLSELTPGQRLSIFIPEDRFAIVVDGGDFDNEDNVMEIDDSREEDDSGPPKR